ncbi:hypothetical protein BX666DRAFT_2126664 [Dichotomocladium elegans]|nr:hypothetical protein BX666DRAFT_2126664 [Dichotomocladium elegans]
MMMVLLFLNQPTSRGHSQLVIGVQWYNPACSRYCEGRPLVLPRSSLLQGLDRHVQKTLVPLAGTVGIKVTPHGAKKKKMVDRMEWGKPKFPPTANEKKEGGMITLLSSPHAHTLLFSFSYFSLQKPHTRARLPSLYLSLSFAKSMKPTMVDNLMYLDDYIDTIEALPLELQRNFTLLRELDGYAQELVESVAKESIDLINTIRDLDPNARIDRLKELGRLLTESLKRGEEKVALAKTTFDAVERHCNRLDADLVKFEEESPLGHERITSQPGLAPSARSLLREVAREKASASRGCDRDRKDGKMEKREAGGPKKRKLKDASPPPGSLRGSQALKEPRNLKALDKKNLNSAFGRPVYKAKKMKGGVPVDLPIDPNEPLYCYCQQVSYGEMVACDNTDCEIEWFHLACVDLKTVPKGKWYCDNCASKTKGKHRK